MKVHHINCATMCPVGGRLVNGYGSLSDVGRLVCHVLVVETPDGLCLVDTGLGMPDIDAPRATLGLGFILGARPKLDADETAVRQVVRLGYRVTDVRHIIVTHLDLDHAGGLADFPKAIVHVHAKEHAAAMARSSLLERERYRAAHFKHAPRWALHTESGEPWFGFTGVREVIPGTSDVLMIPLHGHTRGHCGVAVQSANGWVLHAGDAYFNHGELDSPPTCPDALRVFQRLVAIDDRMRRDNQRRLRELWHRNRNEVRIVSAHDPSELDRARRNAGTPQK